MSRESLQRLKDRYFRPVAAYPSGFLTHFGNCESHRPLDLYGYAPCDCGLLRDLRDLGGEYKEKLYPHFWADYARQEIGRYRRNPITTPIEEILPNHSMVSDANSEPLDNQEWQNIQEVFGPEHTEFLKGLHADQQCPSCNCDFVSQLSKNCPYCHDTFPTWKVISGGQTGADIAGLIVAKQFGLETGGWIPKGFRTTAGPRPEYAYLYGMKVDVSHDYVPRTIRNVADSNGTIRLAGTFSSPGEKCTLRAIKDLGKPYIDVDLTDPRSKEDIVNWLRENNIYVLNVAGNAVTTYPEAERQVLVYLTGVFEMIFS